MFSGSIVAIITPFHQGQVDSEALKKLVEWHIAEGTQGIVACGSTGESALLTAEERSQVIKTCVEAARKRIPIIVGCGAPSTAETIDMVKQAETLGADAILVVTPYYVKPNPEGVFRHFESISQASSLPIVIYNNPGRAVVDLSIDLIARLAEIPTVIGLKDSNTDLTRPILIRQKVQKDFCLLSGDDPTAAAYLAHGGHGCISVTANAAPAACQKLITFWQQGNLSKFAVYRDELLPLHQAMIAETNPAPAKYAVSVLGRCQNEMRLPLIPVTSQTEILIKTSLDRVNSLS
jgi:4-hydroxy-tetrahydrodipicolinate synthase